MLLVNPSSYWAMSYKRRKQLYFARGHVADGLVRLDRLQLFEAPLQFFQRLHHHLGRVLLVRSCRRYVKTIDREFVTSAKKIANFNEFSEIKKIRKNSYKNSLNARVGVAFQWNSLNNIFLCYKIWKDSNTARWAS